MAAEEYTTDMNLPPVKRCPSCSEGSLSNYQNKDGLRQAALARFGCQSGRSRLVELAARTDNRASPQYAARKIYVDEIETKPTLFRKCQLHSHLSKYRPKWLRL
jgi:hypothetical protein